MNESYTLLDLPLNLFHFIIPFCMISNSSRFFCWDLERCWYFVLYCFMPDRRGMITTNWQQLQKMESKSQKGGKRIKRTWRNLRKKWSWYEIICTYTHNRTKTITITLIMHFYLSLLAMRTVTGCFPEITLCRSSWFNHLEKNWENCKTCDYYTVSNV